MATVGLTDKTAELATRVTTDEYGWQGTYGHDIDIDDDNTGKTYHISNNSNN